MHRFPGQLRASPRHPRTTHGSLLALTLVLAAVFPALGAGTADDGQAPWVLARTSEDGAIHIYQREHSSGFREFRAVTRVRGTLGGLIALFTDVEDMHEWVYRTREVRRLEVIGEREIYAYTVIGMPWPFADRDAVLHIRVDQDPGTRVVTIRIESVDEYYPHQSRRVRMPVVESTWTVAPVGEGLVEVTFQGYGDPGGNLSSPWFRWFVDLTSWEAPLSTFQGLRRQLATGRLDGRRVDYIRELP